MQLPLNQLPSHLKQPLAPIYLLYGEELLLRQEARDLIFKAAKQAGYHQYQRFDVDQHFNWSQLHYECNSLSLFNDKTIIELSNPQSKFDQTATKVLITYSQNPAIDKLLLIVSDKLSSAQQKSSWVQAIKQRGIIISVPTIQAYELPRWIAQRLQQYGLVADNNSMQLLAELTEGNLLACQQAIEKLRLLFPHTLTSSSTTFENNNNTCKITSQDILKVASNHARFNIFALGDYLLKGDSRRVLTIINNLKAESVEPTLILWLLTRELRQLITMLSEIAQGKSLQQVVAGQWQQRQSFYKAAINRLTLEKTKHLLRFAQRIDFMIKGLAEGDIWQQLLRLSLAMVGNDRSVFYTAHNCQE